MVIPLLLLWAVFMFTNPFARESESAMVHAIKKDWRYVFMRHSFCNGSDKAYFTFSCGGFGKISQGKGWPFVWSMGMQSDCGLPIVGALSGQKEFATYQACTLINRSSDVVLGVNIFLFILVSFLGHYFLWVRPKLAPADISSRINTKTPNE